MRAPARQRQTALLGLLLACAAAACLTAGLLLPSIEFKRLFFLTDRHSMVSVLGGLWRAGETSLAMVLAVFSILLPALKIVSLMAAGCRQLRGRSAPRSLLALSTGFGRWSMLDVFVLALVVFYVKTSGLGDATSLPGIWLFGAAVLLTMMAAHMLARQ